MHHLAPSRVLHIAAIVTLCEAYMGIDPHFTLWSYFFRTQFLQGLSPEATVLGCVDIYIRSRHGVDPYFHLPMSRSTNEWWRVWFFLRNDVDASLPAFMGNRPTPQSNWGYRVA
jgi:hypothetical protein